MRNRVIFCDFDGTITKGDTVYRLLENHANLTWLAIEKQWINGQIGSKECLQRQIDCVDYISAEMLNDFIEEIEIDEHFSAFVELVQSNNIDLYIVSDGFDLLINKVLEKNNLSNIKIFSNELSLKKNRLILNFPHSSEDCDIKSGLCKCSVLKHYSEGREIIYIGDGRSDICASKSADVLFAKGTLAKHCEVQKIDYVFFDDFKTIADELDLEKEQKCNH